MRIHHMRINAILMGKGLQFVPNSTGCDPLPLGIKEEISRGDPLLCEPDLQLVTKLLGEKETTYLPTLRV